MIKNKFVFIVLIIIKVSSVKAQATKTDPTDFQGWVVNKIAFDLKKKWKVEAEYQTRFYKNITTYYGSFYGINLQKKITKKFELEAGYMLSKIYRGTYNSFSFGFDFQTKVKKVKADIRALYQNQSLDYYKLTRESIVKNFVRARFRIKLPVSKKFDIAVSTEPILRYDASRFVIDNYRHELELKYSPNKKWDFQLFYINRPDLAKSYKRLYHVIGLGTLYQLKIKKVKSQSSIM
jgi:hypothetical protein